MSDDQLANLRVIWDKTRNPTKHVSDVLRIKRWELRMAIHIIKARNGVQGSERVIIYDDGKVTDTDGNEIGNIYDEI